MGKTGFLPGSIREHALVLGIDLAGAPHRPTGMCLLHGLHADTFILFSDREIVSTARSERPDLVAIDAPLSLPPGRVSIADRNGEHYRACDLELRRWHIPFFPITLGPMRLLTERGMHLAKRLGQTGLRCVEIYPGGAQDLWGIPRARRDPEGLRLGLFRLGLRGLHRRACDHELDAASGALVGRLFLLGKAEVFGEWKSGAILMPLI